MLLVELRGKNAATSPSFSRLPPACRF